jgi:hypothetical protein
LESQSIIKVEKTEQKVVFKEEEVSKEEKEPVYPGKLIQSDRMEFNENQTGELIQS